jgi:hypothetical protein
VSVSLRDSRSLPVQHSESSKKASTIGATTRKMISIAITALLTVQSAGEAAQQPSADAVEMAEPVSTS